ncbi:TPA: hypothetical protein I8W52_004081 [Morganella morganii]|nr:hypothetical protein [Morganella morganii]
MIIYTAGVHGITDETGNLTGYADAINSLAAGEHDKNLGCGFSLMYAVFRGLQEKYYSPTDEQRVTMWRWIVAACFISEMQQENGTVEVKNRLGGTDTAAVYANETSAMSVYPSSVRFALIVNLEEPAKKKYGEEAGIMLVLKSYMAFVDTPKGCGACLSDCGREGLSILHDEYLDELNTNGIPPVPTLH